MKELHKPNSHSDSGELTLGDVAREHLSLHINDHLTIQADIESIDHAKVLDPGPFVEEAVQCPACHTFYFEKKEVNHISEWDVCSGCPIPELEETE
jgi:hypothetical protein